MDDEPVEQPPVLPTRPDEDYGYPNGVKEENKPPRSHIERDRNGESSRSGSEGSSIRAAAETRELLAERQRESEAEPVQEAPVPPPAPVLATEPVSEPEQPPAKKAEAPKSPPPSDLKKRKSIRRTWFKTEKRVPKSKDEPQAQQAVSSPVSNEPTGAVPIQEHVQEEELIEPEAESETPLRQWSTSEGGETPPTSRKAKAELGQGQEAQPSKKQKLQGLPEEPEGQQSHGVKKEGSGRFSLFRRTKSRRVKADSTGRGKSFNVDKKSTQQGQDGASASSAGFIDALSSTPPQAGRRESKFQENL